MFWKFVVSFKWFFIISVCHAQQFLYFDIAAAAAAAATTTTTTTTTTSLFLSYPVPFM